MITLLVDRLQTSDPSRHDGVGGDDHFRWTGRRLAALARVAASGRNTSPTLGGMVALQVQPHRWSALSHWTLLLAWLQGGP